jgi:hypothetical protein
MSDDKKVQIATIAEKWPTKTFAQYVSKADPNEGMPRDLMEILFAKLNSSIELDESNLLNEALSDLIDNGLDLNRRVDWLQLNGKESPKVFLAAMTIESISQKNVVKLMLKNAPTDDVGTGRSILKSTINNYRYGNFEDLFNSGVRATDIEHVNDMMIMLAVSASDDPEEYEITELYDVAKKVLSMGPDLFEIKVQNRSLSDVFAEKGHVKLAGMISSLKIHTTVESQEQVKLGTSQEAEVLESTFAGRGM